MHGTGNDYIYVNLFEGYDDSVPATYDGEKKLLTVNGEPVGELSVRISDRHFGVGSDGLIAVAPSRVADVRMIMFNADGSEGKMCGNGIRCVAKFAYEKGLVKDDEIRIETASGIKYLKLTIEDGVCTYAEVNMGQAILKPSEIPVDTSKLVPVEESHRIENEHIWDDVVINYGLEVNRTFYDITCVSMGNPHCVIFTEGIDELKLEQIGPFFENHPAFPEQINTEFVEVIDDHTVRMRVWERGSGETMSCGTGTCAVTVASVLNGYVKKGTEVEVQIRGGSLYDTWLESGEVLMKGPAEAVFDGEY